MSPKVESIPAFLSKLWKIVNDPEIDHIICWSPDGRSFIIEDQAQFWYNILPVYYKHNNMSSFIRQLNLYGFHKIHSDGKEREQDQLQFYHSYFRKNQHSLMNNIKRKINGVPKGRMATTDFENNQVTNFNHMAKVLVDVKQLQNRQESVDEQLASMKKENAALWRELALLRQKHMKQQQLVNKLIHFLVHIVNPNRSDLGGMGRKRKYPLMINDAVNSAKMPKENTASDRVVIHEVENEFILPHSIGTEEEISHNIPDYEVHVESPENFNDLADNLSNANPDTYLIPEMSFPQSSSLKDNELQTTINEDKNSGTNNMAQIIVDENLEETPTIIDFIDLLDPVETESSVNNVQVQGKTSEQVLLYPNMSAATDEEVPVIEDNSKKKSRKPKDKKSLNFKHLTVATRNTPDLNQIQLHTPDDLENHLENTQGELDSIKELLLDGYSLDVNTVFNFNNNIFNDMPLQLFMSDNNLPKDVASTSKSDNKNDNINLTLDPGVSSLEPGNELMPYNSSNLLDFENLFENDTIMDNSIECSSELLDLVNMADSQNQLNTPNIKKRNSPDFASTSRSKTKQSSIK